MARFRATINFGVAKAGEVVDRDPLDPRTIALVSATVLEPLDGDVFVAPDPTPAPAAPRSGVQTTRRRKDKVKAAAADEAPAEIAPEVDVFGDRDGGNADAPEGEAQVEVEGSADPES